MVKYFTTSLVVVIKQISNRQINEESTYLHFTGVTNCKRMKYSHF